MRFIKTHAYGNDFLLVPEEDVSGRSDLATLSRDLCDRHRGIGADGLILFGPGAAGTTMRLFNADGSFSELSGNGLRCLAAWIAKKQHLDVGQDVVVQTDAGEKRLRLLESDRAQYRFRAAMGLPEAIRQEQLDLGGETISAVVLRVGNPQCVVIGPLSEERLHRIGAGLTNHPAFPEGTNVELAEVEAPERVRILIWERGVGPTEASGTGACASAVAAAAFGGAGRSVDVIAPGGTQHVEWTADELWLTGWAAIVATGQRL
jgi:diaminopimelate epimerase